MKIYPGILYDLYWRLRSSLKVGIEDHKRFATRSFIELHPHNEVSFDLDEKQLKEDPSNQMAAYMGKTFQLSQVGYKVLKNINLIGAAAIAVNTFGRVYLQSCLLDIYSLKNSGTLFLSIPFLKRKVKRIENAISIVNLYNIGGNFNYFHWVNDSVLLMEAWQHFKKSAGMEPYVIIPNNIPRQQLQFLSKIGVPDNKLISWEGKRMKIDNLILYSTNRTKMKPMDLLHPGPFKWLKSCIQVKTSSAYRKIFVSRQKSRGRRFLNESDYKSWIKSNGFEEIYLEELTVLEQLKVFQESKIIIGAHGAGLTNIFMCNPGTRIVELFGKPPAFYTDFYRLANQLHLKYQFVVFDYKIHPDQSKKGYQEIDLIFDPQKLDTIDFSK